MSKTVVLGITGSIAAYKSAELASLLVKRNYTVHVIMTPAATRFITPLTLQAISQNPVHVDMFASPGSWEIGHVSLAGRADLILVAPATADFLARLAAGMADDLLAATILAARAPVLLAPAMNDGMYANPVLQEKIAYLKKFRAIALSSPNRAGWPAGQWVRGGWQGRMRSSAPWTRPSRPDRTWQGKESWSPPGLPGSPWTRSGFSPITVPARWVTLLPRRLAGEAPR